MERETNPEAILHYIAVARGCIGDFILFIDGEGDIFTFPLVESEKFLKLMLRARCRNP